MSWKHAQALTPQTQRVRDFLGSTFAFASFVLLVFGARLERTRLAHLAGWGNARTMTRLFATCWLILKCAILCPNCMPKFYKMWTSGIPLLNLNNGGHQGQSVIGPVNIPTASHLAQLSSLLFFSRGLCQIAPLLLVRGFAAICGHRLHCETTVNE